MLFIIFFLVVLCFGLVLLVGAPYLPVHKKQAQIALDGVGLKPGMKFYELGCGDGRMLKIASKTGASIVGVELNPILFVISKIRLIGDKDVSVKFGNFWKCNLSDADVVYVFLLDKFMNKLDYKLSSELKPGAKLISYTFEVPNKKPIYKKSGIYIYQY